MGKIDLGIARSWLFVPGDRPDRFDKAAMSAGDIVICDLEDAVSPERKHEARGNIASWLHAGGRACVRINPLGGPAANADLSAIAGTPGLVGVMVPKADDPDQLTALAGSLPSAVSIVALIETAQGVRRVYEMAVANGVARLAFGSIDYALDVGAVVDDVSLLYARSMLVNASAAARLGRPIDGVTTALDDDALVDNDAHKARRLGFGGKLCVHPRQTVVVNAAFAPTEDQLAGAHRIVAAANDGGAQRVDGQLVDRPLIVQAQLCIQQAEIFAHADRGREQ